MIYKIDSHYKRGPYRRYLPYIILAMIIPLVVLSIDEYIADQNIESTTENTIREEIQGKLKLQGNSKTSEINSWLFERKADLLFMVRDSNMIEDLSIVLDFISGNKTESLINLNKHFSDVSKEYKAYTRIMFVATNGSVIIWNLSENQKENSISRGESISNPTVSYANKPYVLEAIAKGRSDDKLSYYNPVPDSIPTMDNSQPIISHVISRESGEIIGTLHHNIDMKVIYKKLVYQHENGTIIDSRYQEVGLGLTGEQYLVHVDTKRLISPSRFEDAGILFETSVNTEGVNNAIEHGEYFGEYIDYRNEMIMGYAWYFSPITDGVDWRNPEETNQRATSGFNWVYLVEMDIAEIEIPIAYIKNERTSAQMNLLIIVSISSVFIIITTILFFNKVSKDLAIADLSYLNTLLLKNTGEGIFGIDKNGKSTFVNPAVSELTGWDLDELQNIFIHDLLHHSKTDGRPYIIDECQIHQTLITGNANRNREDVFFRKDGSNFAVEYISKPIRVDNEIVGVVVSFSDISELKQKELELKDRAQELARSNAELAQFANVASHDLQEPLRKITMFSELIKSKYADKIDATGLDYIDRMTSSTKRMKTLIDDLLSLTKIGITPITSDTVDLNKIIKDVMVILDIQIEETKTRILYENLPVINGNRSMMIQLFQNLISNSIKFRKLNIPPIIEIKSTKIMKEEFRIDNDRPYYHQIMIKDNGIGFDPAYANRIFTMFQRLHGKSQYDGTGMGLAICKKIIDLHGGTIKAKSDNGNGATFTFTIPAQ